MWSRIALLAGVLGLVAGLLLLAGKESRSAGAILEPHGGNPSAVTNGPLPAPQPSTQEPPSGDSYCQTCHADESLSTGFADGRTLSLHVDARVIRDSVHELLSCVTCHDQLGTHPDEDPLPPDFAAYRTQAAEMCARCHEAAAEGYAGSAHWKPVFKEGEGATCIDCHSPDGSGHSVAATSDPESPLGPARVASACGSCHEQALETYERTSHGKVARFGDAWTTATCVSCHSDHNIQTVDDLTQPEAMASLSATCAGCHDGADASFARAWPGHSEGAPSGSSADILERLGFFMAAAVVAAGLVHVSVDFVRRRIDGNEDGV